MRIKKFLIPISVATLGLTFIPATGVFATQPIDEMLAANYESSQWSLDAVHAADAWDTATGDGVTIGLIDSGVDSSHPDLQGQLTDGASLRLSWDEYGEPVIITTDTAASDFEDAIGHGTHTAGIIGALHNDFGVTGLAYGASIMPVRLENLEDVWTLHEFAIYLDEAIRYAADNGADVISMSLGGPALEEAPWDPDNIDNDSAREDETIICDAVDYAYNLGVFVVAAAGNDYEWGNPASIPGHCDNTFEVGAVGPNSLRPSSFSTTDNGLDVMAPGETILSTYPTYAYDGHAFQDFPYVEMSGTSMATPMVAAAAALYLEAYPDATPSEVGTAIRNTATDMGPVPGWDPMTGTGMLDADALVNDESAKTNLNPTGYLRLIALRDSMNASWGATVVWDTPYGSSLPDSYNLEVWQSGQETPYYSVELGGEQVRATVPLPPSDTYSYIVLEAVYEGGSTIQTAPILFTVPEEFVPDLNSISGMTAQIHNGLVEVNWDEYFDENAEQLNILFYGPGLDWNMFTMTADDLGHFPTNLATALSGTDPLNSDIYIEMWASDSTGQMRSDTSRQFLAGVTPVTVGGYEVWGQKVVKLWGNPNQLGCPTEGEEFVYCEGSKFGYRVQFARSLSASTNWTKAVTVNVYLNNWGSAEFNMIEIPRYRLGGGYQWMRMTPLSVTGKPIRGATPVILMMEFGK